MFNHTLSQIIKHVDWRIVFFGFLMASIDVIVFPLMKFYKLGYITSIWFMWFAMGLYAIQPWIFLKSLSYGTITVLNLYWDLASDLLVTFVGLFILGEQISVYNKVGVVLSFISLFFLSFK
jgi:drug/metabolite transporter (DMT)-like permease